MADYISQTKAERKFGLMQRAIRFIAPSGKDETPDILKRINPILESRAVQIGVDLLGWHGGQPYIDARLSRFAGESKVCWEGGSRHDGTRVTGRKNQAHCTPHLNRVVNKLNQYVFSVPPIRDDLPPDLAANITRSGTSVNDLMMNVSSFLTVADWAWIGVDMPLIESPETVSVQFKNDQALRPYWRCYSPLDVVDWAFDLRGKLLWVVTCGSEVDAIDPMSAHKKKLVRTLWTRTGAVKFFFKEEKEKLVITKQVPLTYSINRVPFVLVGVPSKQPTIFDNIEKIQRTIMDLESVLRTNYFDTCFGWPYIPESAVKAASEALEISEANTMSLLVGHKYPILMAKGDVTPGYITPDTNAFKAMRDEINSLKQELFDAVGFMFSKDKAAAETAASKAWNALDVQAVLRLRAQQLQDAETEAAIISNAFDSTFPAYTPIYNKGFDVGDLASDIASLVLASNTGMPVELSRVVLRKLLNQIDKIGSDVLTDEQRAEVMEAIEQHTNILEPTGFERM